MAVLGLVWGCFGLFWVVLLDFGVVLRCFPLFLGILLDFVIFCGEFGFLGCYFGLFGWYCVYLWGYCPFSRVIMRFFIYVGVVLWWRRAF